MVRTQKRRLIKTDEHDDVRERTQEAFKRIFRPPSPLGLRAFCHSSVSAPSTTSRLPLLSVAPALCYFDHRAASASSIPARPSHLFSSPDLRIFRHRSLSAPSVIARLPRLPSLLGLPAFYHRPLSALSVVARPPRLPSLLGLHAFRHRPLFAPSTIAWLPRYTTYAVSRLVGFLGCCMPQCNQNSRARHVDRYLSAAYTANFIVKLTFNATFRVQRRSRSYNTSVK